MHGTTVSWSSNDALVATVDGSGLVRAVANGTATITATATITTGSASGGTRVTVSESSEAAALVALYTATDGPNWVDNAHWLTHQLPGNWYGVETDNAGRIVSIQLSGQWDSDARLPIPHRLSGSMPAELGNLPHLVSLDLGLNHLTGPIPPELGTPFPV